MKHTASYILLLASALLFVCCNTPDTVDNNSTDQQVKKITIKQLDDSTVSYGDHTYTVNGEINFNSKDHKTPTASVTFTNVPLAFW